MNNKMLCLNGKLSGDHIVSLVKIIAFGGIALAIAYGAYEKGYHLKGKVLGVELEITPGNVCQESGKAS